MTFYGTQFTTIIDIVIFNVNFKQHCANITTVYNV